MRGQAGLIDFACQLARVHGTVVGVGLCVGGDEWDPFAVLSKEITIVMSAFFQHAASSSAAIDVLASDGQFRPQALITERIDLVARARDIRGAAQPHNAMQGSDRDGRLTGGHKPLFMKNAPTVTGPGA